MKPTSILAFVTLLFGSSALKAKTVDLSEFAGKYVGTVAFSTSGTTFTGSATSVFKVNKTGSSGNLAVTANAAFGSTFLNVSNSFNFAKNKTVAIAAVLPPIAYNPISGTYSVKKGVTITGSATFSAGGGTFYPITLSAHVKKTSRRATLTATYIIYQNGIPLYTTTYIGSHRIKK